VGYDIQRRLDDKNENDEVPELKEDRDLYAIKRSCFIFNIPTNDGRILI
jgi:hypothetical protein